MDKYIVGKYFKDAGLGSVVVFGSIVGLIASLIIVAFTHSVLHVPATSAGLMIVAGLVYISALLPYFYALQSGEASRVVPLFQIAPIFSYVLAYAFLQETLAGRQIIAALIVIVGAIVLSIEEPEEKNTKLRLNWYALGLITLSSFLFALNGLIFKVAAKDSTFWTTAYWQYLGVALGGLLLLFYRPYLKQFKHALLNNRGPILALVGISEGITVVARLCFFYASLLAPLALVATVNGFQPFFIFIYGVILTIFFPKISQESLLRKHVLQKVFSIALLFLGTYLLFR